MKSLALPILMIAGFAVAPSANARMGQEGNGGDSVRLDIVAVRGVLYQYCDRFQSIASAGIKCKDLKAKMDQVGTGPQRLLIQDHVSLSDGVERDGRNRPSIPDITFSRTRWIASGEDEMRKFGIVLHEFLGLMNIERTDDYRISSQAVNELRDLGIKPKCANFSGSWINNSGGRKLQVTQIGCDQLVLNFIESVGNPLAINPKLDSGTLLIGNISSESRTFLDTSRGNQVTIQMKNVASEWADENHDQLQIMTNMLIRLVNSYGTMAFTTTSRLSMPDSKTISIKEDVITTVKWTRNPEFLHTTETYSRIYDERPVVQKTQGSGISGQL